MVFKVFLNVKVDIEKLDIKTDHAYHIPVLQVLPLYPRSHPPTGHVPRLGSHGWLKQWQLLEQLFPNVPDTHSKKSMVNVCGLNIGNPHFTI